MLRSFLVLFICCVVLSAAQKEPPETKDSWDFPSALSECGPNEVFDCIFPCPPQKTCRNRDMVIYCTAELQECEYQCVCKEGFVKKTLRGECIPSKKCDL